MKKLLIKKGSSIEMIDLANLPVDITYQITHFRDFLVASWPFLDMIMEDHDWEDDGWFSDEWIQVNWEFLVERELLGNKGYLIAMDDRKRSTSPDAIANYKVVCQINQNTQLKDWIKKTFNYQQEELLISGFLARRHERTFGLYPPFDFVEVRPIDRKKVYIIPFDSCKFWLKSITSPL